MTTRSLKLLFRRSPPVHKNGFTLIETILYVALFALIVGGIIVWLYQIIQGTEIINAKIMTEQEANFILQKIGWTLTGVQTINSPASGTEGNVLSVNKINYSENPIVFDLDSGNIRISKMGGNPLILNSERIGIQNLNFQHLPSVSGKPAAIKANFQINSQLFEITKYLRR